jgi:hypothetical protein
LEENESVTASPSSARFAKYYRQHRPQTIDEVRELIGITAEVPHEHVACCHTPDVLASRLVTPGDLEAKDDATRHLARDLAHAAGRAYVRGISTVGLEQWKAVLDKYVVIGGAIIYILKLGDIDIANGATLTLSANTHGLYANHITIHGSGRIVCQRDVTIRSTSLQGIIPPVVTSTAGAAAAAAAREVG